jgi:hypothetical protein
MKPPLAPLVSWAVTAEFDSREAGMEMREVVTVFLPVLLIVAGFVAILWAVYWEYRKKVLQYEERRLMIEKGMMPPPLPMFAATWPAVKQHQQQLRHEERRLMIEKGLVPPDEEKPATPDDFLRRGTLMVFLSIGCGIGALVLRTAPPHSDREYWLFGVSLLSAVVGPLGLGHLVYYFFTKNRKPSEPAART